MHQPPINHRARNHYPLQASNATRSSNNYNRTGRAHFSSSSTTWLDLESLPLYDTSSWEGIELRDRYGHEAHKAAPATYPYIQPRFYIPPSNWWRIQASTIFDRAFQDVSSCAYHPDPCTAIKKISQQLMEESSAWI